MSGGASGDAPGPGCFGRPTAGSGGVASGAGRDMGLGSPGSAGGVSGSGRGGDLDRFGEVALVTGAGRGIGRAIAEVLAGAGYRVGLCARTEEVRDVAAALRREGAEAQAWELDVADTAAVRRWVDEAAERFGRLDVLVNNAALNRAGYLPEADPEEVDAMFAVNVRAPLVAMQAALVHMDAAGGGRIVNIASWVGRSPRPGFVAYSASKAALLALTRGAALEFADRGITVNAVSPGNVLTRIWETSVAGTSLADGGRTVEQFYADSVAAQPIARGVTPEEIAAAVLFCCSPAAGSMTGETITVASGL